MNKEELAAYVKAKRKLQELFPDASSETCIMIGNCWDAMMDKDPTGASCVEFVARMEKAIGWLKKVEEVK